MGAIGEAVDKPPARAARGGREWEALEKAFPAADPVTPGDLAATIFWRFGIDHTKEIQDPLGRPHRIATGAPIRAIF
ncbi:MAG: DUF1501 domain-containing protein [Planctomycetota bacterium]|nr:MAG: DUF1501 domain-containing protein [Planctomycetota bacterium]